MLAIVAQSLEMMVADLLADFSVTLDMTLPTPPAVDFATEEATPDIDDPTFDPEVVVFEPPDIFEVVDFPEMDEDLDAVLPVFPGVDSEDVFVVEEAVDIAPPVLATVALATVPDEREDFISPEVPLAGFP